MKQLNRLLYVLVVVKIVLPFFLHNSVFEPHRDEFLYLEHAKHPDWGYLEVPPLLSLFALITNFFGAGLFWIKIWPSVFGGLTFLLAGKIVLLLGGRKFALLLTFLPFVLGGYLRLFFLFQANFLDVFFWTAMAFCFIHYIFSGQNKWLYGFGVCAGLGLMSKYSAAFFIVSLLAGLLLTGSRKVYLNKHLYFSGLIAFLIFMPNLLWQYQHNFPVIHHMAELREQQLQYINPADFIAGQIMMNFPCVFIWIAGLAAPFVSRELWKYRVFTWAWLSVIALLLFFNGKDYYALGAYPVLFAIGALWLESATRLRFRWVRYALLTFSIALGLYALPVVMPVAKPEVLAAYYKMSGLSGPEGFKWEDQKYHPLPQDFADMIGWKEMSRKAAAVYRSLPAEQRKETMIYCRAYATAGALNHYGREFGLPTVYSDDSSFLLWMPEKYNIKNLLLVGHQIPDKDDRVFQEFDRYTIKDSVDLPLFRENGIRFILYEGAKPGLNKLIEESVAEQRKGYFRN